MAADAAFDEMMREQYAEHRAECGGSSGVCLYYGCTFGPDFDSGVPWAS